MARSNRRVLLNWRMQDVLQHPARFKTVVGGRRIGKTELLLAEAVSGIREPDQTVWYICPTYKQAKKVFWARIKDVVPRQWLSRTPHETDLRLDFKHGSSIELMGADNPDSLRGVAVHKLLYDEVDFWADPEETHSRVLRPMLATTHGKIVAAGSPDGFRLLHEFYQRGGGDVGVPQDEEWKSWLFKTSSFLHPEGHLDPLEYESAKRDMDARSFDQEWNATFLMATGRVAYAWTRDNCKPVQYDPNRDVHVSMDFNVTPAASIMAHVDNEETVLQFGEVAMTDAWTQLHVDEIARRLEGHQAGIYLYGDPAGRHRAPASKHTDWQLVEQTMRGRFGGRVFMRNATNTIPERDTINALNGRICNAEGTRRYFANPLSCRESVRDFEQCKVASDGSGTIDKTDRNRSHWLDAAKYFCHARWPIAGPGYSNLVVNF